MDKKEKIVMKFGGVSVANGGSIKYVAGLISGYAKKGISAVAVVSALEGVTNSLLEASEEARKGNREYVQQFKQKMLERHLGAINAAIGKAELRKQAEKTIRDAIDELERILTGVIYVGELTDRSKDYILSFGERLSAPILCGALNDLGIHSRHFSGGDAGIVTDDNFGDARPLMSVTKYHVREKLEPLIEKGIVPVVTGYIAATQSGAITTLGRGGSDYTATILGASLPAKEVWIWKDVDGLMTADPKIVPSARMMPEISFQEAIEMAVFGAKAIHPRALEPAMEENIPVRVRNVFDTKNPGTRIVREKKVKGKDAAKAIALIKGMALVNISGTGMVGSPGIAAKIFEVLGKSGVNVLMVSQSVSEANISLMIKRSLLENAVNSLEMALLGKGAIHDISTEDDVCAVAVVGAGMQGTPGVASRVFTAVAKKGINVRMIAQGSSELNISFVVKEKDGEEAVRAIHNEFQLE